MKTPAVYALLISFAAVVLWHPWNRTTAVPSWIGLLFRSGHVFLPFGIVLGGALSATPETSAVLLNDLWPLVAFVAGWVGYGVGIRGDWHHLQSLGVTGLTRAIVPSLLAAAVTGGATFGVLLAASVPIALAVPLSLVVGASGACSGAPILARLADVSASNSDQNRFRRLTTAARADDIVVCALALAAFAALPAHPGGPSVVVALFLPLLGGMALGGVAWLLLGGTAAADERLLLGIAVLGVGAGFGAWIEVSPAVVCAVLAATLATLPGQRAAALREPIAKLGRPAVVILMVATGLSIAPYMSLVMLGGAAALVALRAGAFALAGVLQPKTLGADAALLSAPGQLGVVVAFTFYHVVGGELAADILGATAIGAFVDQLLVSARARRRAHVAVEAPCEEV